MRRIKHLETRLKTTVATMEFDADGVCSDAMEIAVGNRSSGDF